MPCFCGWYDFAYRTACALRFRFADAPAQPELDLCW
jgi:hypothetical protein